LPDDADTQVISGGVDDLPVVQLSVNATENPDAIVETLREAVIPDLERIDGVRGVELSGVRDKQVTIDIDPAKMAEAGLTTDAVRGAVQASGVVLPGGEITEDGKTMAVQTGAEFASVEDIAAIEVPSEAGPVELQDVAEVTQGPVPARCVVRADGLGSCGSASTQSAAGDTVDISAEGGVRRDDLEATLGPGAFMTVVFDQAPFIEHSIGDLSVEGLLGLVFAVV